MHKRLRKRRQLPKDSDSSIDVPLSLTAEVRHEKKPVPLGLVSYLRNSQLVSRNLGQNTSEMFTENEIERSGPSQSQGRQYSDPDMPASTTHSLLPTSPYPGPDANEAPVPHKCCQKCGKVRRQASSPNHPSSSGWLSQRPDPILEEPSFGIEGGHSSRPEKRPHPNNSALLQISGTYDSEFSPLVADRPQNMQLSRKTSDRPYLHQIKKSPNRSISLIRRISNAIRPSASSKRNQRSRKGGSFNQRDMYLPKIEPTDRPGSPFSFVASDLEMLTLTDTSNQTKGLQKLQHQKPLSNPEVWTENPEGYYTGVQAATPGDEDTVTRLESDVSNVQRHDSVMRRAVSGSIRRFKSLRVAHREWYRSDMAIEGIVTSYDVEPVRDTVIAW